MLGCGALDHVDGFYQSKATSEGNDEAHLSAFLLHHTMARLKRFGSGSSGDVKVRSVVSNVCSPASTGHTGSGHEDRLRVGPGCSLRKWHSLLSRSKPLKAPLPLSAKLSRADYGCQGPLWIGAVM